MRSRRRDTAGTWLPWRFHPASTRVSPKPCMSWQAFRLGVGRATGGLAEVRRVLHRPQAVKPRRAARSDAADGTSATVPSEHDYEVMTLDHSGEFSLVFVVQGSCKLLSRGEENKAVPGAETGMREWTLCPGDCFSIPAGVHHTLSALSDDLELVEVALPADLE